MCSLRTAADNVTGRTHRPAADCSPCGRESASWQALGLGDVTIRGELAARSLLTYARLEGQWYRPEEVFAADQHGWPGDWEGRLLLGLTLLARATGREPAFLEEILERVPQHLNARGYFGPLLPRGRHDEQQMAGHSWYLRGLLEYYDWQHEARIEPLIEKVVENLLLTARGNYARYPLVPEMRQSSDHWKLSHFQSKDTSQESLSDAGCAFIMLDGATHAFQVLRTPALRELIEEMIARFQEMDLAKLGIQTHATLSGLRGIVRMFELTGNRSYLELAARTFEFYKREAWTAAYGNYNWFGRPCWTEPCAIIDSLILAMALFRHTGQSGYLADAHHIYYNAFLYGQRANGAFGSDRCLGAQGVPGTEFLTCVNYESYWCCTMRAGEGFARIIQSQYLASGQSLLVAFYENSLAEIALSHGAIRLRQKTHFPYDGQVSLEVLDAEGEAPELCFFVPPGTVRVAAEVDGDPLSGQMDAGLFRVKTQLAKGDRLEIRFELAPRPVPVAGRHNASGHHAFQFGPVMLGWPRTPLRVTPEKDWYSGQTNLHCEPPEPQAVSGSAKLVPAGQGCFQVEATGQVLLPLCDSRRVTAPERVEQALFTEP